MARCDQWGNHVTADFRRVYADNEGTLYGCPGYRSMTDIKSGKATGR